MKKAKMQRMVSFMDNLLAEYNFSMSEGDVVSLFFFLISVVLSVASFYGQPAGSDM